MTVKTADHKKAFYEQTELWERYLDFSELSKFREIMAKIPNDIESILDLGCGKGNFVNLLVNLNKYKRIVGLDMSREALKYVRTTKIQGDITKLPFRDKNFDLVICMQLLEHLEDEELKKSTRELERVSKKYIIITVPNNEDLYYGTTLCPNCRQRFHLSLHVRSFNERKLYKLFNDFRPIEIKKTGPMFPRMPSYNLLYALYDFYDKFFPRATVSLCPHCGYQFKNIFSIKRVIGQRLFFFTKLLLRILFHFWHDYRWLFAIYRDSNRG